MAKVHILSIDSEPLQAFSAKRRAEAAMIDLAISLGFKINPESMLRLDFGTHLVDSDGRSTGLTLMTLDVE